MIHIKQINESVQIIVNADLINTSHQLFDLEKFKAAIISQLHAVYRGAIGIYKINFSINLSILSRVSQCSPKKVLFQIVDETPHNNPAICDFKGLRIKLNKLYINDIISGKNSRTIPHEVGHLLGWDHPHANAQFESINTAAHTSEQQLTETERQCNLMSQSWYAQKAGIPLQNAMHISEKQIEVLLQNYKSGSLNKNWHLKYFLWWKKIL
jgi:hypothetical protein